MIRSLALVLSLVLPFTALAQDDASLLAPLSPHPTKPHRHRHPKHNDLDQLAPLNLPTTLTVEVPGVEGAQVTVDGKAWGLAPIKARTVRAGAHRIHVTRPGFAAFSRRVVVRSGDRAKVAATLRPTSAILTVRSTPPGAEVSLDDEPLGETPVEQKAVRPGSHELRVHAPGFMDDVARLTLRLGQDSVLERTLEPVPPPQTDRPVQVSLAPRTAPEAGPLPTETYTEVEAPSPWYKRWYVWAGAGAVVAAAAVGIAASSAGTHVSGLPTDAAVCNGPCDAVLKPQ